MGSPNGGCKLPLLAPLPSQDIEQRIWAAAFPRVLWYRPVTMSDTWGLEVPSRRQLGGLGRKSSEPSGFQGPSYPSVRSSQAACPAPHALHGHVMITADAGCNSPPLPSAAGHVDTPSVRSRRTEDAIYDAHRGIGCGATAHSRHTRCESTALRNVNPSGERRDR